MRHSLSISKVRNNPSGRVNGIYALPLTRGYPTTGPTLFIYGAAGPGYGSFEISLDGGSNVSTAHAPQNVSGHLLFNTTSLEYANHTLKMTNLGAQSGDDGGNQFLFDYLQTTVQLAPAG